MENIKKGTVYPPHGEDWWIGKEAICPVCTGVFKLQIKDRLKLTLHRSPNGDFVSFICPTWRCGHIHTVGR